MSTRQLNPNTNQKEKLINLLKKLYINSQYYPKPQQIISEDDTQDKQLNNKYQIFQSYYVQRKLVQTDKNPQKQSILAQKLLFKLYYEENVNLAMIVGQSGSGKTTLFHYLSYKWSKQKQLSSHFTFLFKICISKIFKQKQLYLINNSRKNNLDYHQQRQKQQNSQRYYFSTLIDIIEEQLGYELFQHKLTLERNQSKNQQEEQPHEQLNRIFNSLKEQKHPRILLLIDQFDWFEGEEYEQERQFVKDLILNFQKIPNVELILFSNPYYALNSQIETDLKYQMVGFSKLQIKQYLDKKLSQQFSFKKTEEEIRKMYNIFSKNDNIAKIASNPLNINVLSKYILENEIYRQVGFNYLPQLYQSFINNVLQDYLRKRQNRKKINYDLILQKHKNFLQSLAYNYLTNKLNFVNEKIMKDFIPKQAKGSKNKLNLNRIQNLSIFTVFKKIQQDLFFEVNPNRNIKAQKRKLQDSASCCCVFRDPILYQYLAAKKMQKKLNSQSQIQKEGIFQFIKQNKYNCKYLNTFKFMFQSFINQQDRNNLNLLWQLIICNTGGLYLLTSKQKQMEDTIKHIIHYIPILDRQDQIQTIIPNFKKIQNLVLQYLFDNQNGGLYFWQDVIIQAKFIPSGFFKQIQKLQIFYLRKITQLKKKEKIQKKNQDKIMLQVKKQKRINFEASINIASALKQQKQDVQQLIKYLAVQLKGQINQYRIKNIKEKQFEIDEEKLTKKNLQKLHLIIKQLNKNQISSIFTYNQKHQYFEYLQQEQLFDNAFNILLIMIRSQSLEHKLKMMDKIKQGFQKLRIKQKNMQNIKLTNDDSSSIVNGNGQYKPKFTQKSIKIQKDIDKEKLFNERLLQMYIHGIIKLFETLEETNKQIQNQLNEKNNFILQIIQQAVDKQRKKPIEQQLVELSNNKSKLQSLVKQFSQFISISLIQLIINRKFQGVISIIDSLLIGNNGCIYMNISNNETNIKKNQKKILQNNKDKFFYDKSFDIDMGSTKYKIVDDLFTQIIQKYIYSDSSFQDCLLILKVGCPFKLDNQNFIRTKVLPSLNSIEQQAKGKNYHKQYQKDVYFNQNQIQSKQEKLKNKDFKNQVQNTRLSAFKTIFEFTDKSMSNELQLFKKLFNFLFDKSESIKYKTQIAIQLLIKRTNFQSLQLISKYCLSRFMAKNRYKNQIKKSIIQKIIKLRPQIVDNQFISNVINNINQNKMMNEYQEKQCLHQQKFQLMKQFLSPSKCLKLSQKDSQDSQDSQDQYKSSLLPRFFRQIQSQLQNVYIIKNVFKMHSFMIVNILVENILLHKYFRNQVTILFVFLMNEFKKELFTKEIVNCVIVPFLKAKDSQLTYIGLQLTNFTIFIHKCYSLISNNLFQAIFSLINNKDSQIGQYSFEIIQVLLTEHKKSFINQDTIFKFVNLLQNQSDQMGEKILILLQKLGQLCYLNQSFNEIKVNFIQSIKFMIKTTNKIQNSIQRQNNKNSQTNQINFSKSQLSSKKSRLKKIILKFTKSIFIIMNQNDQNVILQIIYALMIQKKSYKKILGLEIFYQILNKDGLMQNLETFKIIYSSVKAKIQNIYEKSLDNLSSFKIKKIIVQIEEILKIKIQKNSTQNKNLDLNSSKFTNQNFNADVYIQMKLQYNDPQANSSRNSYYESEGEFQQKYQEQQSQENTQSQNQTDQQIDSSQSSSKIESQQNETEQQRKKDNSNKQKQKSQDEEHQQFVMDLQKENKKNNKMIHEIRQKEFLSQIRKKHQLNQIRNKMQKEQQQIDKQQIFQNFEYFHTDQYNTNFSKYIYLEYNKQDNGQEIKKQQLISIDDFLDSQLNAILKQIQSNQEKEQKQKKVNYQMYLKIIREYKQKTYQNNNQMKVNIKGHLSKIYTILKKQISKQKEKKMIEQNQKGFTNSEIIWKASMQVKEQQVQVHCDIMKLINQIGDIFIMSAQTNINEKIILKKYLEDIIQFFKEIQSDEDTILNEYINSLIQTCLDIYFMHYLRTHDSKKMSMQTKLENAKIFTDLIKYLHGSIFEYAKKNKVNTLKSILNNYLNYIIYFKYRKQFFILAFDNQQQIINQFFQFLIHQNESIRLLSFRILLEYLNLKVAMERQQNIQSGIIVLQQQKNQVVNKTFELIMKAICKNKVYEEFNIKYVQYKKFIIQLFENYSNQFFQTVKELKKGLFYKINENNKKIKNKKNKKQLYQYKSKGFSKVKDVSNHQNILQKESNKIEVISKEQNKSSEQQLNKKIRKQQNNLPFQQKEIENNQIQNNDLVDSSNILQSSQIKSNQSDQLESQTSDPKKLRQNVLNINNVQAQNKFQLNMQTISLNKDQQDQNELKNQRILFLKNLNNIQSFINQNIKQIFQKDFDKIFTKFIKIKTHQIFQKLFLENLKLLNSKNIPFLNFQNIFSFINFFQSWQSSKNQFIPIFSHQIHLMFNKFQFIYQEQKKKLIQGFIKRFIKISQCTENPSKIKQQAISLFYQKVICKNLKMQFLDQQVVQIILLCNKLKISIHIDKNKGFLIGGALFKLKQFSRIAEFQVVYKLLKKIQEMNQSDKNVKYEMLSRYLEPSNSKLQCKHKIKQFYNIFSQQVEIKSNYLRVIIVNETIFSQDETKQLQRYAFVEARNLFGYYSVYKITFQKSFVYSIAPCENKSNLDQYSNLIQLRKHFFPIGSNSKIVYEIRTFKIEKQKQSKLVEILVKYNQSTFQTIQKQQASEVIKKKHKLLKDQKLEQNKPKTQMLNPLKTTLKEKNKIKIRQKPKLKLKLEDRQIKANRLIQKKQKKISNAQQEDQNNKIQQITKEPLLKTVLRQILQLFQPINKGKYLKQVSEKKYYKFVQSSKRDLKYLYSLQDLKFITESKQKSQQSQTKQSIINIQSINFNNKQKIEQMILNINSNEQKSYFQTFIWMLVNYFQCFGLIETDVKKQILLQQTIKNRKKLQISQSKNKKQQNIAKSNEEKSLDPQNLKQLKQNEFKVQGQVEQNEQNRVKKDHQQQQHQNSGLSKIFYLFKQVYEKIASYIDINAKIALLKLHNFVKIVSEFIFSQKTNELSFYKLRNYLYQNPKQKQDKFNAICLETIKAIISQKQKVQKNQQKQFEQNMTLKLFNDFFYRQKLILYSDNLFGDQRKSVSAYLALKDLAIFIISLSDYFLQKREAISFQNNFQDVYEQFKQKVEIYKPVLPIKTKIKKKKIKYQTEEDKQDKCIIY